MLSRLKYRHPGYQAFLSGYTFFVFGVTLCLLYAGGFTTTIQAGMVFPDWPFSNGSLNPPGWTTDQAMLAEHSHRLLGATTGLLTIGLVLWTHLRQARAWLRRLSWFALVLVIFQGLLGGMRVLLVSVDLAKVHGITAQIFLCTLAAIAVGHARWWQRIPRSFTRDEERAWGRQKWLGVGLCLLIVGQLVVGAVMRHRGAGMAIPYFPHSTGDGDWLPADWNWAVQIHFAHRLLALAITLLLGVWAVRLLRSRAPTRAMKVLAGAAIGLLLVQIALGAGIIWSVRQPIETTLHVLNGAILLSTVWAATFAYFRPTLEGRTDATIAATGPVGEESRRVGLQPQRT